MDGFCHTRWPWVLNDVRGGWCWKRGLIRTESVHPILSPCQQCQWNVFLSVYYVYQYGPSWTQVGRAIWQDGTWSWMDVALQVMDSNLSVWEELDMCVCATLEGAVNGRYITVKGWYVYVYISDSFTCSVLTAKGLCWCFHVPVGYECWKRKCNARNGVGVLKHAWMPNLLVLLGSQQNEIFTPRKNPNIKLLKWKVHLLMCG